MNSNEIKKEYNNNNNDNNEKKSKTKKYINNQFTMSVPSNSPEHFNIEAIISLNPNSNIVTQYKVS